jgi:hypothetical protein
MEATLLHCPPGEQPDSFTPGDFCLHRATTTHGPGGATTTIGKLIQAGERRRFGNTDFARWTHCALIVSEDGDIIEALESGVERRNISKYVNGDYLVAHVEATDEQRTLAVGFAAEQVGDRYDKLDFVGLAVQAIFGWDLSLHADDRFICSELVARATEKYIPAYPLPPEAMMPADLAHYWGAETSEPLPKRNLFDTFLDLLTHIFRDRAASRAS